MKENKIIRSFWNGGPLSNLEKLSIYSFIKNGHEVEVFVYDQLIQLPIEVKKRDAREILSCDNLFIDSRGTYSSFSDWFRFKMLFELGGWWTDLDSICLRPFNIVDKYCFSSEGDEQNYLVNCGNIKAPKGASFLAESLYEIGKLIRKKDYTWGKYGINLMRQVLLNYEYQPYLYPPSFFCPIYYSQVSKIISGEIVNISDNAYAVHLWNGMWKMRQYDKNGIYPASSLFEKLKQKYLMNPPY